MKRICLVLISALALLGTVLAVPPAGAAPHAASQAQTTRPYQPFPVGYTRATLSWLRNNVVGMKIGPNVHTGYGQATITGFVKGCPECDWYRADLDYTQYDPTFAVRGTGTEPAARHRGGFCWPWENYIGSGCSGWNSSYSWDWVGIWNFINGDWHPWDSDSTVDHFEQCIQGAQKSLVIGVVGKGAIARFTAGGEVLKVSPEGAIFSVASGCIANLWW